MRYFFVIIAVLLPAISEAQLTAPGRIAERNTTYPSSPGAKDPIFIYCNASGFQKGALNVTSPGGTGPFNYSWYKWSDASNSFTFIPGVSTSSINNLDEGGYKVIISGGIDTSFVGWIFFDEPPIARASLGQQLCDRLALDGDTAASIHKFYYNDILYGSKVSLDNEITFLWSSNPSSYIPSPDFYLDPIIVNVPPPSRVYRLPLEDLTYKLKVYSIGCSSESSFFYESIHVKADFTADPINGEAPLEVTFTDKSIRESFKSTWGFGEKQPNGKKVPDWIIDSLWILSSPFTHTYYKPGEYTVKLTIESVLHCIDSIRFDKIVVDHSKLDIPNVFTPDGDGLNDNFIVESKSLRFISVEIFSRSGMKVYSFYGEGERLREWQGWDGNVNKSSIKASSGVYFYIIRAYGWDDVDYNSKEHRGFVYLYR